MMLFLPADSLARLWPRALPGMIDAISKASEATLAKYGIVTLPDLIDFIAECSEETGGMTAVVESAAYTADRAHEVWPSIFPTAASAEAVVKDPVWLFYRTYGGRLGNRLATNDGYSYRGRGMIQITGRDWYAKIGARTGLPLVEVPDLAADPAHILECACAYWKLAGASAFANAGNFIAEVRRINGGTTNMASRLQWRAEVEKVLISEAVTAIPSSPSAPAVPADKGTKPMNFFTLLSTLLADAPEAVTLINQIMANPLAQDIENLLGVHTTVTPTPGQSLVIEPKSK
jgi:putative chitinase